MRRSTPRLLAAVAALAVLGAACGNDKPSSDASPNDTSAPAQTGAASRSDTSAAPTSTASPAAELRAGLTSLLQEHVYLAGITTGTALAGGDFKAAAAALEQNTQGLQGAVSSVYGEAGGKQFGDLWRKHIGFFVDYTTAAAKGDAATKQKAMANLDGYRQDFGAFIASATKGALSQDAVAAELKTHVDSLTAAIDAQVAKDPSATAKLRVAADHMPMTAKVLAGAIARQFPDKFPGSVDGSGAELRAGLTSLLQEHVYLAGITTGTALAGGDFKVPAGVLEQNTAALQGAVASVYGDAGGKQFGDLWRKHIGFFVDYTTGAATSDAAKKQKAVADLDGYRADFGAFLEAATKGGLPKQAVADELTPHVQSLAAAVDAQAAKDPAAFEKLRVAAGHMPMTANILAGAIAAQFPNMFGS